MTTKISWNEYDKLPYDTFMWQGIDGTKVLAHFATGCDANSEGHFTTYNSYLEPDQVIGGWKRYSNKDLNQEYLISFGYGDGGGGPTVEMLEHGHRMGKGIDGCPTVVQQSSRKFFEELEKQVINDPKLPTWAGELYLEFHRGTLTSEALVSGAAKLPRFELVRPPSIINRTTVTNMQAGLLYGHIGQVTYIIQKMREELGRSDAVVVATGGLAALIVDEAKSIDSFDGLLTLKGLRLIYEKNKAE